MPKVETQKEWKRKGEERRHSPPVIRRAPPSPCSSMPKRKGERGGKPECIIQKGNSILAGEGGKRKEGLFLCKVCCKKRQRRLTHSLSLYPRSGTKLCLPPSSSFQLLVGAAFVVCRSLGERKGEKKKRVEGRKAG